MRKRSLDMVHALARRDERVVFIGSDLSPHLLGEQRRQFPRWGMDHRVVGQHSAERAVLDRQGFHSCFVEPQRRMSPPGVGDHSWGEVEPEGVQPQVVQHGRQMAGSAPDISCPQVPRATHKLGEGADHVPRERLRLQPISEHRRIQVDDPVIGGPGLVLVLQHGKETSTRAVHSSSPAPDRPLPGRTDRPVT